MHVNKYKLFKQNVADEFTARYRVKQGSAHGHATRLRNNKQVTAIIQVCSYVFKVVV
jgi:hypothetical protein